MDYCQAPKINFTELESYNEKELEREVFRIS